MACQSAQPITRRKSKGQQQKPKVEMKTPDQSQPEEETNCGKRRGDWPGRIEEKTGDDARQEKHGPKEKRAPEQRVHLFDSDQFADGFKPLVADTRDFLDIFDSSKRPSLGPVIDNPLGQDLPNSGEVFQLRFAG